MALTGYGSDNDTVYDSVKMNRGLGRVVQTHTEAHGYGLKQLNEPTVCDRVNETLVALARSEAMLHSLRGNASPPSDGQSMVGLIDGVSACAESATRIERLIDALRTQLGTL